MMLKTLPKIDPTRGFSDYPYALMSSSKQVLAVKSTALEKLKTPWIQMCVGHMMDAGVVVNVVKI